MERDILKPYLEAAARYYQSSEYRHTVQRLSKVIEDIRKKIEGKRIAFDLEGVLVNNSFLKIGFGKRSSTETRIRRPLAQEALEAVAEVTETVIWTSASEDLPQKIIANAELRLPKQVSVIQREDFHAWLRSKDGADVRAKVRAVLDDPTKKLSREEHDMLISYKFKVPSLFGVDYLFDDMAEHHSSICRLLDFPEDTRIKSGAMSRSATIVI